MPYSDIVRQREYQREWAASRRASWLAVNGPCVDCGSWSALEVDHVDHTAKVAHSLWTWSRTRREAELAKCVVRCHDCHAAKTTLKGEHARGEQNGQSRLTAIQVVEIFGLDLPQRTIAARFGIGQKTVSDIKTRKTWKHLGL